jgi:hypothetical protein
MIHRYRLDITPHMNVVNRGMISNTKHGEWVKYGEAHNLLKEAYEHIMVSYYDRPNPLGKERCVHCLTESYSTMTHNKDCIVPKAEAYLEGE